MRRALHQPVGLLALLLIAAPVAAHEPDEEETPQRPSLTAPVVIERADAEYPEAARAAGVGGTVGLELDVGADGSVVGVKVTRPVGFGLDEAAVAAARKLKFKPALRDGKPIASTVMFDQSFVIRPHLTAETVANVNANVSANVNANVNANASVYEGVVVGRSSAIGSAQTIRNLDFDVRPRSSPNDILRVVPGLLAVQHQGGGKAEQLFLRGFDADHGTDVGIFIDGIPVNLPSHAHGQGYADLHWLIPEALDRVEVTKGPYDVRWGDFATAGAVNLVTRDRFESSSVQYTLGMLPTVRDRAVASGRFVGIVSPSLPGWAAKLHPWIAFDTAYDNGPFTTAEDLKRYNLFAKLSYDVTPQLKLGIFLQAYGSGWIGSGQIPQRDAARIGRFGSEDPSEGGVTERQMVTAFLKYRGGDHEVEATVYVTRYRLSLFNDFTFFLADPVRGDELEQDDARTFSGGKLSYHFHRRWRGVSFRTTVGAEMRWDGVHVERWHVTSQPPAFRARLQQTAVEQTDILDLSAWAEEDILFNRFVRLVAGLRADYFAFSTNGARQFDALSPKTTLMISPVPRHLELYASFGMGFHSNNAQAAVHDGETALAPDGTPFTVRALPRFYGGELGARAHLFDRLDVSAAFWASYLENETVFDADAGQLVPGEPTRRFGFDLQARARIVSWLSADFDLSQASANAVSSGGAIALAPRLYLTGGLTVTHPMGVRAGLAFRYLGERPAFDENSPEYQLYKDTDPSRVTAQAFFVLDAYVAYRWRFLEFAAAAQNLLSSKWREAQLGNRSCTRDEVYDPTNPNFGVCGIGAAQRTGVADVHFTPGVPFNLQLTAKVYF